MNKTIKAKWIAALRSGKYKQAKGVMREGPASNPKGFCCLGVLCDVVGQTRFKAQSTFSNPAINHLLPYGVRQRLGYMNDDGKTFKQIAAYIEKNL